MKEKIIVYTNSNCSNCKQLKDILEQKNIDFVEKVTDNFKEEWNQVMYAIGVGITPTVLFKNTYFVPGRDFNNPNQVVEMLNYFEKPTLDNDILILERIKTLNYNIATTLTDLDRVIKNINNKLR